MALGISPEQFWTMNPRKLKPYQKARELKREMLDEQMWMMGQYVQVAVAIALDHGFNGSKARSEYPKKPILVKAREENARENMSQGEKLAMTEILFKNLEQMQKNFEKNHPREE